MRRRAGWIVVLLVTVWLNAACDPSQRLREERAENAVRPEGDILVGLVFGSWEPLAMKGSDLAVEELNRKGVIGRQIKTIVYDDRGSVREGLKVARKLARNADVIAVIGHWNSHVAIATSIVYQGSGMVFIAHRATNPALTRHGFNYVFRNTPSDDELGEEMARLASMRGYRKMVLLLERGVYGEGLGRLFHEAAQSRGIEIVAARSYAPDLLDYRLLISEFENKNFDAIFVSGVLPGAARIIKQSRSMGVSAPFLGGDGLDDPSLWSIAGKAAEETVVPAVFSIDHPASATRDFVKRFKARYCDTEPDVSAAQAYDAMKVLARAIEKGESAIPLVISSNLQFTRNWDSVTSPYSFTQNGDVIGRKIFFKVLRNGKFVRLEV